MPKIGNIRVEITGLKIWRTSIIQQQTRKQFHNFIVLENIVKTKVHRTQPNERNDFVQNDKSSLFAALEVVRESYIQHTVPQHTTPVSEVIRMWRLIPAGSRVANLS